jgi:beta-glucuronidase
MNFSKSGFLVISVVLLCLGADLSAQHEIAVPQNIYLREKTSLNGYWNYFVDRYESFFYDFVRVPFDSAANGGLDFAALDGKAKDKSDRYEYNFDGADSLLVPGDWNSQREKLFYYEGSVWYRKLFTAPTLKPGEQLVLHFGAVNYRADVYLNGKKAGVHEGGFTPFAFDVSTLFKEGVNSLVVRVDNQRDRSAVPTDVTDWWNYGGITRDVSLVVLPANYIADYDIHLSPDSPDYLEGYMETAELKEGKVTIRCEELGVAFTATFEGEKRVSFKVKIPKAYQKWSPDTPKLYTFTMEGKNDSLKDKIGLRTISTRGNELLLNGQPIFLRGICAHEENPLAGRRANSREDAMQLLQWAQELNANYMRLAHYPHNEHMPRLADSLGILLWEEIPVYWTIDWENPTTYANAEKQLTELINRDHNRASVIIWSLANETPSTDARLVFLKNLAQKARDLDATRLLSAALFKQKISDGLYTITDPFGDYTDLVSFNQYLGWYEGLPDIIDQSNFVFSQNKPVIVSEFGAGAKAGFHGDELTRWSEEYQDKLYENTLEMLDRMPNLVGVTPWILADFRSPRRQLPVIQEGWNRKGLIGQDGSRKLAFYRLQQYYKERSE